jgi:DNA polymerase I-like protein with 3'-5' exonuclease and polymerase domains
MRAPPAAIVDFETEEILPRPDYPPRPVGVAIWTPRVRPRYLAWGHPTGNNATKRDAKRILTSIYREYPVAFHHAKFDVDVGETHLGLRPPRVAHCTMILAFLNDPNARDLGLKTLAAKLLGMPDEEAKALAAWLREHVPEARKTKRWGAFISKAPGLIASPYAIGDVIRTGKLLRYLFPKVLPKMLAPYERELALIPILLENERDGFKVATRRLVTATGAWEGALEVTDDWLRKRLDAPSLDVDSKDQLADALESSGTVASGDFKETPGGKRSTAWDNLLDVIDDRYLVGALQYRSKLANSIRVFARPWIAQASSGDGHVRATWNQVRHEDVSGRKHVGARTGRLSSQPNVQNIPRIPPYIVTSTADEKRLIRRLGSRGADAKTVLLRASLKARVTPLPNLRDFVVPDERDETLLGRDYSQHELRVLAHFEGADLLNAYIDDPGLDQHAHARKLINERTGATYERKEIKNTGFGIIYGMGLGALAKRIEKDIDTARAIRAAYRNIFPGLRALEEKLLRTGRRNETITTWGGRVYPVEDPIRTKEGRLRTFEYKLINTLIQGSASDCIKQAIIDYSKRCRDGRMKLTVHDEFLVSASKGAAANAEMRRLTEAMEKVRSGRTDIKNDGWRLPMMSEGKSSTVSWARMQPEQ